MGADRHGDWGRGAARVGEVLAGRWGEAWVGRRAGAGDRAGQRQFGPVFLEGWRVGEGAKREEFEKGEETVEGLEEGEMGDG